MTQHLSDSGLPVIGGIDANLVDAFNNSSPTRDDGNRSIDHHAETTVAVGLTWTNLHQTEMQSGIGLDGNMMSRNMTGRYVSGVRVPHIHGLADQAPVSTSTGATTRTSSFFPVQVGRSVFDAIHPAWTKVPREPEAPPLLLAPVLLVPVLLVPLLKTRQRIGEAWPGISIRAPSASSTNLFKPKTLSMAFRVSLKTFRAAPPICSSE